MQRHAGRMVALTARGFGNHSHASQLCFPHFKKCGPQKEIQVCYGRKHRSIHTTNEKKTRDRKVHEIVTFTVQQAF